MNESMFNENPLTIRKRMRFKEEDNLALLKEVLALNPFQNADNWNIVQRHMVLLRGKEFSVKTLKEHLDLLIKVWFEENKTSIKKSGIEESYSEKHALCQNIYDLMAEFRKRTISNKKKTNAGQLNRDTYAKRLYDSKNTNVVSINEEPATKVKCNNVINTLDHTYTRSEDEIDWLNEVTVLNEPEAHADLSTLPIFNFDDRVGLNNQNIYSSKANVLVPANDNIHVSKPNVSVPANDNIHVSKRNVSVPANHNIHVSKATVSAPANENIQPNKPSVSGIKTSRVMSRNKARVRRASVQRQGLSYLEEYDKTQKETKLKDQELKLKELQLHEEKLQLEKKRIEIEDRKMSLLEYETKKNLEIMEERFRDLNKVINNQEKLINFLINRT